MMASFGGRRAARMNAPWVLSLPQPMPKATFHGYLFRVLTKQGKHAPGGEHDYVIGGHMTGGFSLLAFPAKFGASGVMTLIVNQNGIVYEKNLGLRTAEIVSHLPDPDDGWKPALP